MGIFVCCYSIKIDQFNTLVLIVNYLRFNILQYSNYRTRYSCIDSKVSKMGLLNNAQIVKCSNDCNTKVWNVNLLRTLFFKYYFRDFYHEVSKFDVVMLLVSSGRIICYWKVRPLLNTIPCAQDSFSGTQNHFGQGGFLIPTAPCVH
jgi:hypothetical protein